MKIRASLRHQLGLSQIEMAMYLNIHLTQLAMYEIGKRELPSKATLQLAEIEVFLHEREKENPPAPKNAVAQLEIILKELHYQQKENEFKQVHVQMQWEAIQKKVTQKQNLLAVVNHFSQEAKSKTNPTALKILALSVPRIVEPTATKTVLKLQLKRKALEEQRKYIADLITETQIELDTARQNH